MHDAALVLRQHGRRRLSNNGAVNVQRSTVKEVYCSKFCNSKRRAGVSFLLLRISSPDDGVPSHSHFIICISKHVGYGA
jgi:hypothetical protein